MITMVVMTTWHTRGETVRGAMALEPSQREMTLTAYEAARCDVCGVRGVETYERDASHVCALCDVPGGR